MMGGVITVLLRGKGRWLASREFPDSLEISNPGSYSQYSY